MKVEMAVCNAAALKISKGLDFNPNIKNVCKCLKIHEQAVVLIYIYSIDYE
jgi:hypothetical protein